eukprot:403359304
MKTLRKIVIDPKQESHICNDKRKKEDFCTNKIETTKYNYVTFLPKSILAQFSRVSNIYFLVSAVLCSIPYFSPLPGYTAITPLALVLLISVLREALEDYKRRVNDKITNKRVCLVFDRSKTLGQQEEDQENNPNKHLKEFEKFFSEKQWCDVKCGDIVYLKDGENFPADVLILMSSAENGECFVQTSSLDGERALKHKQCLAPVTHTLMKKGIQNFNCQIHTQQPSKNLYEFNGFIESDQFPDFGTTPISEESKRRTARVENKQIGLRGSNIANTDWIIGVVVFTGNDTKLMLNSGQPRFKQSRIEKVVNIICIYLIFIQAGLCLIMSIFSGFFTADNAQFDKDGLKRKAEYLFYTEFQSSSHGANRTQQQEIGYNSGLEGLSTYGSYYILLNTIIPVSLVVSVEFVKFLQTPFFSWDNEMFDKISMKHCQPMSMTLHEELAQVKYVFADKTGTLTANQMQFKACSIASVCYDEDYKDDDYDYIENSIDEDDLTSIRNDEESKEQDRLSNYNEKQSSNKQQTKMPCPPINHLSSTQIIRELLESNKFFMNENVDLGKSKQDKEGIVLNTQNDYIHQFWLCIVLCHDVIVAKDEKTGLKQYQGTSPDEITLLYAAKEVGYEFLDRTSNTISVRVFDQVITYSLLQKIDFTSDRKKMTVIIQDQQNENIILFSKGADMAILERLCDKIEQPFFDATQEDLIKFCTKGFRTLCFGMRVIDLQLYGEWALRYDNSQMENIKYGHDKFKIEGITENITEKLEFEIENKLFLLGATALEDKLQEGVPEVIDDLHQAGIKVWMLTGDKLETAENIGFSSKMFNEKMFIFKLQTHTKMATRQRLYDIENKMLQIEKQHCTPIIGTQFILNPNPQEIQRVLSISKRNSSQSVDQNCEIRNIINALEEFKHESRYSEHTQGDSWAKKPALRRKLRKRLEEIVPNKNLIAQRLLRENQFFQQFQLNQSRFIPISFDKKINQYLMNKSNVYRSSQSAKGQVSGLDYVDNEDDFAILVEGQTLHYIMDSKKMTKRFLNILSKCKAVVVCRASPSQKGLVVKMIQDSEPLVVTLSIGDGANDVNMIQKAHIGVGIFGKEGYQAASSSDYAIGQFRFLRRLLFVHGRWNGIRLSHFMLFFFHKNLVFTIPQFWFGWYNGFSGQSFYDDNYLTVFNSIATSIALIAFGVLDQDINPNDEKSKKLIELFYPFLYQESQRQSSFTRGKFFMIACISVGQSILVFGAPIISMQNLMFDNGKDGDLYAASLCSYFAVVFIHYFFIMPFTNNFTSSIVQLYLLSFFVFCPLFVIPYNYLPDNFLMYRLYEIMFENGYFWLIIILIVACSIVPIKFYFWAQSLLFPSLKNLIMRGDLNVEKILKEADPARAKLTHDLLKQKQQEQVQKWKQEYQNNDQSVRIEKPSNIDQSFERIALNHQIQQDASCESPSQSFSRKGLSPKRNFTCQTKREHIRDEKLVLRRLKSQVAENEDENLDENQALQYNLRLSFNNLSQDDVQEEEKLQHDKKVTCQILKDQFDTFTEHSENLGLETMSIIVPSQNQKIVETSSQMNDNDTLYAKYKQIMMMTNVIESHNSQTNRKSQINCSQKRDVENQIIVAEANPNRKLSKRLSTMK